MKSPAYGCWDSSTDRVDAGRFEAINPLNVEDSVLCKIDGERERIRARMNAASVPAQMARLAKFLGDRKIQAPAVKKKSPNKRASYCPMRRVTTPAQFAPITRAGKEEKFRVLGDRIREIELGDDVSALVSRGPDGNWNLGSAWFFGTSDHAPVFVGSAARQLFSDLLAHAMESP